MWRLDRDRMEGGPRWDLAEMLGGKEPTRRLTLRDRHLLGAHSVAPQLAGLRINDSTIGCVLFTFGVASRGRVACYTSASLERK
jgi:hypothetical protein